MTYKLARANHTWTRFLANTIVRESAMKKYYENTNSTTNTYERLLSQRREGEEQEQEEEEEEAKTGKDNCDKEEEDSKTLIERDLRRTPRTILRLRVRRDQ